MKLTDLQEATHHRLNYIEWIIDVWKEDGDDQIEMRGDGEDLIKQLTDKFGQPNVFDKRGEPEFDERQGALYEWLLRNYFGTGKDDLYQILFYPEDGILIAGTFPTLRRKW
jgi:hypothetical protein